MDDTAKEIDYKIRGYEAVKQVLLAYRNDAYVDWGTYEEDTEKFSNDLMRAVFCVDGHTPEDDQCSNPEHRFCAWCFDSTPNEEVKREAPYGTCKICFRPRTKDGGCEGYC